MGVLSGSGCSQSFLGITSGRMMISSISSSSESSVFVFVLISVLRSSAASVTSVTTVLTPILTTSTEFIVATSVADSDDVVKADNGNSNAIDIFAGSIRVSVK